MATEPEPTTQLLNIDLSCRSHTVSIFRSHLNVAKVNSLIVEMGTLCQPGEVTSGERQPKDTHNSTSSVFNTLTLWWREKQKEREQKREKKEIGPMCENRVRDAADGLVCLCLAHHFIAPYFTGLDKSPGLQPIIAATLSRGAPTSSCSWPSC